MAWGNGGCADDGASSRFHLLEIASHGYLVVASGRILSGPGAPAREPGPAQPGQILPPRAKASDLTDAVDWALAENKRAGSPYFRRVDPGLVADSGWSFGLQALQVANDPRVKTMVLPVQRVCHVMQAVWWAPAATDLPIENDVGHSDAIADTAEPIGRGENQNWRLLLR